MYDIYYVRFMLENWKNYEIFSSSNVYVYMYVCVCPCHSHSKAFTYKYTRKLFNIVDRINL